MNNPCLKYELDDRPKVYLYQINAKKYFHREGRNFKDYGDKVGKANRKDYDFNY